MQRNKFNLNRPHGVPFTRPFFVRTQTDRHGFESLSYVCPASSAHTMEGGGVPSKEEGSCPTLEEISGQKVDACVQENLISPTKETTTQTSKTVLSLDVALETPRMSPDSLSPKTEYSPRNRPPKSALESIKITESTISFERKSCILRYLHPKPETIMEESSRDMIDDSLTKAFLEKSRIKTLENTSTVSTTRSRFLQQTSPLRRFTASSDPRSLKSQSCIDTTTFKQVNTRPSRFKVTNVREKTSAVNQTEPVKYFCKKHMPLSDSKPNSPRMRTFMSPTISSEKKNQMKEIVNVSKLISPTMRGRSASPKAKPAKKKDALKKVPYIDLSTSSIFQSCQQLALENPDGLALSLKNTLSSTTRSNMSSTVTMGDCKTETETDLNQILIKLKDADWNTSLRGLAEVVECCRVTDTDFILPHMTTINQRVIELLKSPRSHVCRTTCQAVGHLFEYVKDVRRPEFDEIVDTLLCRTADSNKFIRHDANLALDCMVTHIPILHSVRAICNKAPDHKNSLVRTACARLVVCAAVIAGPHAILHPNTSDYTRKRLISNLVKFLNDKTFETKKYGERLYKLLSTDKMFDFYLKRYLEKDTIVKMRQHVKSSIPNGKIKPKSPQSPKIRKNDF